MITRYHLQNDLKFVEFPYNNDGLVDARLYRKRHAEFKRRHIKVVIQACPSICYCYREYLLSASTKVWQAN